MVQNLHSKVLIYVRQHCEIFYISTGGLTYVKSYVNMLENQRRKCTHMAEVINHKNTLFSVSAPTIQKQTFSSDSNIILGYKCPKHTAIWFFRSSLSQYIDGGLQQNTKTTDSESNLISTHTTAEPPGGVKHKHLLHRDVSLLLKYIRSAKHSLRIELWHNISDWCQMEYRILFYNLIQLMFRIFGTVQNLWLGGGGFDPDGQSKISTPPPP